MADLYDSITAADIPADVPAVAGYDNGIFAWSQTDWDRFTTPYKIVIAVSANWNGGHVLDIETGDATPSQGPGWVKMRQAAGLAVPCLYCNLSTQDAVVRACAEQRLVLGRDYTLWIAHYTGQPHALDGASAVQYADPAMGAGGHYDVSNITDPAWLSSLGFTQEGDTAMTPKEFSDVARAFVRLAYLSARRGEPETVAVIDDWEAAMKNSGFENTIATIFDSAPEFQADLRLDQQLRLAFQNGDLSKPGPEGPPGPATLAPHTHDQPAGETGPAKPSTP